MSFVFREEENIQCEKWCLCFKLNHHFVTNEIPRQPASAATQRDIQPTSANSKHFEHVTLLRAAVPTPTIKTAAPSGAAGHATRQSARWWVIKAGGALLHVLGKPLQLRERTGLCVVKGPPLTPLTAKQAGRKMENSQRGKRDFLS